MTSTTLATLNSQLNTLLEKQASIIRDAQAFAESLELSANMKELKKIAAEWNVIPDNKTRKASYIAALHIRYEEKNSLAEVNEQIEKITFQIKCAEAQECANAQQKVIHVIRTIENEWWVGTEETFHTIYPNEGYEIHFTAHPELPVQIEQEPPQELVAWLDEIREKGIISNLGNAPKSYFITGYRVDGTSKQWRCMDAYQAEENARTLWETRQWARLEINGKVRCPAQEQEETPLQGVASFFEEQQHAEDVWQAQEEIQFAEKQDQLPTVEIRKDGTVGISTQYARLTLSAREAYALLSELYDRRDLLYQADQKDERFDTVQEPQNTTPILYTTVTDHVDTFARMGFPIRYLLPDATTPALFHSSHSSEASLAFLAKYPDARIVSPEQLEAEAQKREKEYWEKYGYTKPTRHHLGTGLLSWPPFERITGRYGEIALFREEEETWNDWKHIPWLMDITTLINKHGSLVAILDEVEYELGEGTFFTEELYDTVYVGLTPDEPREENWLNPSLLNTVDGYIAHKPVELWFVEQ